LKAFAVRHQRAAVAVVQMAKRGLDETAGRHYSIDMLINTLVE
jgi:hypothetical protein